MKEIKTYLYCDYPLGAAEECRMALLKLGFKNFSIKGQRGSHTADVYMFGDDEERFINEILNNVVIGQYRRFYFSNSYSSFGYNNLYYNVAYSFK